MRVARIPLPGAEIVAQGRLALEQRRAREGLRADAVLGEQSVCVLRLIAALLRRVNLHQADRFVLDGERKPLDPDVEQGTRKFEQGCATAQRVLHRARIAMPREAQTPREKTKIEA